MARHLTFYCTWIEIKICEFHINTTFVFCCSVAFKQALTFTLVILLLLIANHISEPKANKNGTLDILWFPGF